MNSCHFILAFFLLICTVVAPRPEIKVGSWTPLVNIDDPWFQNLGRWAVEQQHTTLSFYKVESGRGQPVTDIQGDENYELIIMRPTALALQIINIKLLCL
jgi:hypothetical protein